MIDGFKLKIGGIEREVPPLNIKAIKKMHSQLISWKELSGLDQIDATLQVFSSALTRNYPEITKEKLEEDLTWPDYELLVSNTSQLFEISGLAPKRENPTQVTMESTGDGSTDTSSQPLDGLGE